MTLARYSALLLFFIPAFALAAPSGVAFTSSPQTIALDSVSGQFTLQAQDASGASVTVPQTGCIALESSSAGGQFSSSASNWSAVTVLTMNKSTANKNFFYKDAQNGTHTVTARLVLKPEDESRSCAAWPVGEWGSAWTATQQVVVGAAQPSQATPAAPQSTSVASSVNASSVSVPAIAASVSSDAVVSAGAGSFFEGSAFGSKGEPLDTGVRYIWNFGDGAIAEGKRVFHSFAYPGSYVVVLTVAYHYSSADTRVAIQAIAPKVRLLAQGDGSLLLANDAAAELNVGDWSLRDSSGAFVIPEDTFVAPQGGIRFSPDVLGFYGTLSARSYFPNGVEASRAKASHDSPLRGEPLSAREMPALVAAPLIPVPEGVDIYAPALPAESEETEGEVLGEATEKGRSSALYWGSLAALAGLLGAGAVGARYLQRPQPQQETLPSADEFEIE